MASPQALSSDEKDGFIYLPLNIDDDEIRLLILLPQDKPGVINCGIAVAQLHEELVYEALSHNWGLLEPIRNIQISGPVYQVQENLWEVLQALQDHTNPR